MSALEPQTRGLAKCDMDLFEYSEGRERGVYRKKNKVAQLKAEGLSLQHLAGDESIA